MTLCWGALPLHCVVFGEWHACSWRVSLVEQELLTLSSPRFLVGFVLLDLWFCRSLFVLLFIFFWSLRCLFFFDMRILIAPLVSSNSSLRKQDKDHIIDVALPCKGSLTTTQSTMLLVGRWCKTYVPGILNSSCQKHTLPYSPRPVSNSLNRCHFRQ
jgi:hypothetical protein